MTTRLRVSNFIVLASAAYLGFYVFGLLMGVYSPGEVPYFTIPAVVLATLIVVVVVRARRAPAPTADDPLVHATRHLRETRGF